MMVLFCSFCGKNQYEVRRLIEAPRRDLFICNECVELCVDILEETSEPIQRQDR